MTDINPQKHAYTLRISRELAIDYGLVEPTEKERTEREAWLAEYQRQSAQHTEEQVPAVAAYLALDDPIAKLHAPDVSYGTVYCTGCDMGCSCERANWPCSTATTWAHMHDIGLCDVPVTSWAHVVDRAKEDEG